MTKLIYGCGRASDAAEREETSSALQTRSCWCTYNIPGEWSHSEDLMWQEQEVPATVIGVNKSAGVREADGTLNDSWCRVRYLWTLNLRPTEQARTQLIPNSESREGSYRHAALLLCSKTITKDLITRLNKTCVVARVVSIVIIVLIVMWFFGFILLNTFLFLLGFCIQISRLLPPLLSFSKCQSPWCPCWGPGGWRWTL